MSFHLISFLFNESKTPLSLPHNSTFLSYQTASLHFQELSWSILSLPYHMLFGTEMSAPTSDCSAMPTSVIHLLHFQTSSVLLPHQTWEVT